jgi:hypothetical protein
MLLACFSHHQERLVLELMRRSMRPGESAPSQIHRRFFTHFQTSLRPVLVLLPVANRGQDLPLSIPAPVLAACFSCSGLLVS